MSAVAKCTLSSRIHYVYVYIFCFAVSGDGSCFYTNELFDTTLELSGPDCDPVYRVVTDGQYLYSCCRDGLVRKYAKM